MALRRSPNGFTLIELMVVVAIVAILLGVTLPLMSQWVQRSKLTGAHGAISLAIGKAVGAALRNRHSVARAMPVASVCVSPGNVVTVLESDGSVAPSCQTGTGTLLWSVELDQAIGVASAGTAIECLCFDNTGLLTTVQCSTCLGRTSFDIRVGSRSSHALVY